MAATALSVFRGLLAVRLSIVIGFAFDFDYILANKHIDEHKFPYYQNLIGHVFEGSVEWLCDDQED